jgi:hypothetical protein
MSRFIVWLAALLVTVAIVLTGYEAFSLDTRIFMDRQYEILRRGNDVLAVSVDGYVCFGTDEPRAVDCHRSVPKPEMVGPGGAR